MNKDLLILLQNSMAHSTAINLRNNDKVDVDKVVDDAIKIATRLMKEATGSENNTVSVKYSTLFRGE